MAVAVATEVDLVYFDGESRHDQCRLIYIVLKASAICVDLVKRIVMFLFLLKCNMDGDEGVTPRLLWIGLPGVLEDRRPTKIPPWPAKWHRRRSP